MSPYFSNWSTTRTRQWLVAVGATLILGSGVDVLAQSPLPQQAVEVQDRSGFTPGTGLRNHLNRKPGVASREQLVSGSRSRNPTRSGELPPEAAAPRESSPIRPDFNSRTPAVSPIAPTDRAIGNVSPLEVAELPPGPELPRIAPPEVAAPRASCPGAGGRDPCALTARALVQCSSIRSYVQQNDCIATSTAEGLRRDMPPPASPREPESQR